jgi:hypothetical protein
VPDPTDVPIAGLSPDTSSTASRTLRRRRADRMRVKLLTAAAIAAALLALALILSSRRHEAEPAAAGATRVPGEAGTSAAPARPAQPRATAAPVAAATSAPAARPGASPSPSAPAAAPTAPPASAPTPPPTHVAEQRANPAPTRAAEAAAGRAPPRAEPVERIEDDRDADDGAAAGGESAQLGGRWELTHEVQSTNYGPYQGMRLGYEVTLHQEGDRVYGQGRKVSENGVALPAGQRTPIDVAGRIEDGQVVLYFTEIGTARTSRGTIRWRLAPVDGTLEGRFATDAANSSGISHGRRLP